MNKVYLRAATLGLAALVCMVAQAQNSFDLTSSKTPETFTFTNSLGTAVATNGMVVFEGELKADLSVGPTTNSAGLILASLQLLAQIKLFDELPASNEVGSVQGAVAALKDTDPPAATTGKYYVWGSTNSAPVAWVPLMATNSTQFAVSDGATNYLTFVFYYPTNSGNVSYQLYVGDVSASVMEPSLAVVSPTNAAAGLAGVSLLGTGALKEVSSSDGGLGALSTQIGFSIYDTASGILMVIDTVNESGSGPIKVYAWINGAWQLVGEVPAEQVFGDGMGHRYEIYARPDSGLVAGQSYQFKIVDESGNTHTYDSGLAVTGTKMDSVVFDLHTMTISFNSEANRNYVVKVADSAGAPNEQWAVQFVSQNVGGTWAEYSDAPFTAGGPSTSVKIPISSDRKKAFFKVFKLN